MPKYSVITITSNGIAHSIKCIESVLAHSSDFELIVVDNNSSDGTMGYLEDIGRKHSNLKIIESKKNLTFAENNNLGLQLATGEYVVFLNNDTIVCKDWLDRMEHHFSRTPFKNVGAVGPVSSMSNGRQMVGVQDPEKWHAENAGRWKHVGCLYGWCIMIRKNILDQIGGFDERFNNAYEDNDLCLRIQLAGYVLIIAHDTYIYHLGQGTLRQVVTAEEYMRRGYENREIYFDKWQNPGKKNKLVAVYRTANGKYFEESLERTSKFADSIIIHFCRANKEFHFLGVPDGIGSREEYEKYLRNKFPKICKIGWYDGIFQEDYERGWLLKEALSLHEAGEADWCISVDDDELYEEKFSERVQKMMSPRNPEVLGYWCNWRTIWKNELGVEYYRADSTFGSFMNYRLFRLIKNQEIMSFHPEGHHCGSAPWIADENLRWTNIRVKHLGYDTPEQRKKKHEFYEKNDNFKTARDIGYEDYAHLISRNPLLEKYEDRHGISLIAMIKDEEKMIEGMMENVMPLVDEFIIVDTGSRDKSMDLVRKVAEYCPVPVKIFEYPWDDIFSTPRNFAKELASQPWVLMMDADERFQPEHLITIFKLTELQDTDVVMFNVMNYLKAPQGDDPALAAPTQSARLYRNKLEFYYTGIIHETIDDSVVTAKMRRKVKGIVASAPLHHYGYLSKKRGMREKFDYYERLNLRQIEITEGMDPRPYFNLALHYLNDDKQTLALKNFQKALEIDPKFYHASQQMAALNINNAKHFMKEFLKYMPDHHPAREASIEMYKLIDEKSRGFMKVC